jgi:hypothetical protein
MHRFELGKVELPMPSRLEMGYFQKEGLDLGEIGTPYTPVDFQELGHVLQTNWRVEARGHVPEEDRQNGLGIPELRLGYLFDQRDENHSVPAKIFEVRQLDFWPNRIVPPSESIGRVLIAIEALDGCIN